MAWPIQNIPEAAGTDVWLRWRPLESGTLHLPLIPETEQLETVIVFCLRPAGY
ncbi:hypothetical Protein YC6258_01599 [Gynuella sunshinyii YC6258]|uniref:Uncharacterized protein n=1 Tax=Gynuella sunshinyii YC6258 TaxID=1445510 RepID=A0A0C5VGB2_9GAMM|nr:hypothetical Protein YC6258_01599 [Gynuella sunshinyii YC6258]